MSHELVRTEARTVGIAYLLWVPTIFGFAGLHRFYSGRWISGLLWLATGGLCGIGSLIDLVFIPRMVSDVNEGRDVW